MSMRSGYRSALRLGGVDADPAIGVEITFDEPECLAPGETAAVVLSFWALDDPPAVGTPFWLYEGNRLVGKGEIL